MDESMKCESSMPPMEVGMGQMSKFTSPVSNQLRIGAIDSLNAFLIHLLEKKEFCQAQRIGEALKKIV